MGRGRGIQRGHKTRAGAVRHARSLGIGRREMGGAVGRVKVKSGVYRWFHDS